MENNQSTLNQSMRNTMENNQSTVDKRYSYKVQTTQNVKVYNVPQIAQVCHEVNRAYCQSIGDDTQLSWKEAPEWQKESAIKGVIMHLENPFASPVDSHNSWMKEKEADGWVYGETKDPEAKTHPCMVEYEELPVYQQIKDFLFRAVVHQFVAVNCEDWDFPGYAIFSIGDDVRADKQSRKSLDVELQKLKSLPASRERAIAIRKLQEAIMWLGMDLKRLNEPNPYPDSYNSDNTKIAPTADGLKL